MTTYNTEALKDKALEAYPKLVDMFQKNKKANHRLDIGKDVSMVYGTTTKGEILVHIGAGKIMKFWDFVNACDKK